jgi:hypothetical protein
MRLLNKRSSTVSIMQYAMSGFIAFMQKRDYNIGQW